MNKDFEKYKSELEKVFRHKSDFVLHKIEEKFYIEKLKHFETPELDYCDWEDLKIYEEWLEEQ